MKKSKTVLSEKFREYALSEETLGNLQNCLLQMFIDLKTLCDRYNIQYMMSGGTCLGTVRHKGFIPWDDDIDIMMTREEYLKFREAFLKEGYDDYILAEPIITEGYYYKMPKVYNKKTKLVSVREEGYRKYNMVSIDIFIIENIPDSKVKRKLRSIIYDFCFRAASLCLDYMFPSKPIEEKAKEDKEVKEYFGARKRLGHFFSCFGGVTFYLVLCEKFAKYPRTTSLVGIPSAISYEREILPRDVFVNVSEGEFCGIKVNNPGDYDTYLKNLYGDYMKIPPKEKREIHVAYEIKL